ncbi:MAG: GGDEF domain-containing protein [Halothiobacillaceae bacterium]
MSVLLALVIVVIIGSRVAAVWRRERRMRLFNQLLLSSLGQGVYDIDQHGVCRFINPSALDMLKNNENEVLGSSPHALFHYQYADGRPYPSEDCAAWKTLHDGQPRKSEEWFLRADGSGFPVQVLVAPMLDNKSIVGAVVIFEDISERKRMEAQLQELAKTDALTGLHNRRYFLNRLEEGVARSKRFAETGCVIMLDCDHFKQVNDRYGHAVGDEVLQGLASILRQNMRQTDVIGRIGGEEFAVLLNDANLDSALEWAERVRAAVAERYYHAEGKRFVVTVSMGCASIRADDDENIVLLRADQALYQAKQRGRNRVEMA